MMMNVYCVKDTKVSFMNPYVSVNDAVAVRDFTTIVNSDTSKYVSINYTDMELYALGTFDTDTGELTSDVRFILKGADVKKVGEQSVEE